MSEDWVVHADCAPSDTAEAASLAIATLTRSGGCVYSVDLERLGNPLLERQWGEITADDAIAIVRAELTPGSYISLCVGTALPSGRESIGVFLQARSPEYVRLQHSKPLTFSINPCALETPAHWSVGHADFDALMLGFAGSGGGLARVSRAICGLEGAALPSLRDAYAAYYAHGTDLATDLGVHASGGDVVAALELTASEMAPHRRVNTRVTRLEDGGLLLSITPYGPSRKTEKTLAPLVDGARQLLGAGR